VREINPKLIERVALLDREIAGVDAALEPVQTIVARHLASLDGAAASFRVAPLTPRQQIGPTKPSDVQHLILAAFAALMPRETRALVEGAVRAQEEARPALRMTAAEKDKKLAQLRADRTKAAALLEVDVRLCEAEGVQLPLARMNADPAIWLMVDDDLALVAAGKSIPIDSVEGDNEDEPTRNPRAASTAGRV
jgi:hypothetical protein